MISASCVNSFDQELVSKFYEANPEYKNKVKIKRILSPLTEKQRRELLRKSEKSNYKHYLMIRTQLETGLRVKELCNLVIDQISFDPGLIVIQSRQASKYHHAFKTKTEGSNREIAVPRKLSRLLRSYIGNRKTGYIFESQKGGRFLINSAIGMINKYARQCDSIPKRVNSAGNLTKDIGSHALRRTYASFLLQNSIPIADISKLLGHASVRTTILYLFEIQPVDQEKIRNVVNKMNR